MSEGDDPTVAVGGGDGEPVEVGDRREKHVSVSTADGERVEHGDVYVRHSASGFAVSNNPAFPDDETTLYEKSAIRRIEVTQHHAACFITTATAGEGPALDALRGFRDGVLVRSPIGRPLVRAYDVVSPPVARTLARHPRGRTARAVRWLVVRCAALARRRAASRSRPARAAVSVALSVAYTVGLAVAVAGHGLIRLRERFGSVLGDHGLVQSGESD